MAKELRGAAACSVLHAARSVLHSPCSILLAPSSMLHPPCSLLHASCSMLLVPSFMLLAPCSILHPPSSMLHPPLLPAPPPPVLAAASVRPVELGSPGRCSPVLALLLLSAQQTSPALPTSLQARGSEDGQRGWPEGEWQKPRPRCFGCGCWVPAGRGLPGSG